MAKATELYDFRETQLAERLFKIKIKRSKIEKRIMDAAERFLTISEAGDGIEENDIVAIRMESKKPWLDSECERLHVGRGFSYEEIEKELIGKKKGETFEVYVDDAAVKVTVLSVKRRIVPQLADDMVSAMEIEDVNTVEDFRNYVTDELIQEDKEKKVAAICTLVNRELVKNSSFIMKDGEVEESYEEMLSAFEEEAETEEDLEKLLHQVYHVKGVEAGKKKMYEEIEGQIKLMAVADAIATKDGKTWGQEDYDAFIAASANERMPEEELREDFPIEDFINQQKVDYLQEKVSEYYDDRFESEVIND